MIQARLQALREKMQERGVDAYIIPTADFHESEYVGAYFKARAFMTGFTGSAGTAVVTMTEAGLWTDGRYFVQAEKQLEGSGVTLFRMAEEGVPTIEEYLVKVLPDKGCLGFDGRVVNTTWGKKLQTIVADKNGSICVNEDLVGLIWSDRPALAKTAPFILEEKYAGKSTKEKMADVRAKMAEAGANTHILTCLYDIAWLLNVRAHDIESVPVIMSYLVMNQEACIWFLQEEVLDDSVKAYLAENQITTKPYDSIYEYVKELPETTRVLMSESGVNFRIFANLPAAVMVVSKDNPTELMRAMKNPIEVANTRAVHVKDGVAFTKFMYW